MLCLFYRILGNDLPPVHGCEQTIRNTAWLLANEPIHPGSGRAWILNRIVDRAAEQRLLDMLHRHDERCLVIPFDRTVYRRLNRPDSTAERITERLLEDPRTFDGWNHVPPDIDSRVRLYRRILYVMNVNGARNLALRDGRSRSPWVVPLDGAVHIDRRCWAALQRLLPHCDPAARVLLPALRCDPAWISAMDGNGGPEPCADRAALRARHEPYVVFGSAATHAFDELQPYGRRDKLELLMRLGVARDGSVDEARVPVVDGAAVRLPYHRSGNDQIEIALADVESALVRLIRKLGRLELAQKDLAALGARFDAPADGDAVHPARQVATIMSEIDAIGEDYRRARARVGRFLDGSAGSVAEDRDTGPPARTIWTARARAVERFLSAIDRPSADSTGNEARHDPEFVLYRILGNDLPPRHAPGQTLANLRFILDHESELPGCEKRWIVNRIVDPWREEQLIELLESRDQRYLRVPFDVDEYAARSLHFDGLGEPDWLLGDDFQRLDAVTRMRAMDFAQRDRRLYVMNNNGARNLALRDGRGQGRWVLPWDGNCFVHAAAWRELRHVAAHDGHAKYLVVPMARLERNDRLLAADVVPVPLDEPQLAFRHDALETFDETIPWGRRPKVSLLWRLGVPGPWDQFGFDPWETRPTDSSAERGLFRWTSWVARLSTGSRECGEPAWRSRRQRGVTRMIGSRRLLHDLDLRLLARRFDRDMLHCYNDDQLARERDAWPTAGNPLEVPVRRLLAVAAEALDDPRCSVVDKGAPAAGGSIRDYYQPAPYWWPNPDTADGLPYVRRDGRWAPGTIPGSPGSERGDRTRMQRVFDRTTVLALAWLFSGDTRFSERAADNIRRWFLDPLTSMRPNLRHAQVRLGHHGNRGTAGGLIETMGLVWFLDAVRLSARAGSLAADELEAMRDWCRRFACWREASRQGRGEYRKRNNHGTVYELQSAALAAFVGDPGRLLRAAHGAMMRLSAQFDDSGRQPLELARARPFHYCVFNLQCWYQLATLLARVGFDLWNFRHGQGTCLKNGTRFLLSVVDDGWPFPGLDAPDGGRLEPLRLVAGRRWPGAFAEPAAAYRFEPLRHPHHNVAPFWTLGLDP